MSELFTFLQTIAVGLTASIFIALMLERKSLGDNKLASMIAFIVSWKILIPIFLLIILKFLIYPLKKSVNLNHYLEDLFKEGSSIGLFLYNYINFTILFTFFTLLALKWLYFHYLDINKTYKTSELSDMFANFTKKTDRNSITFLCGKIDFFGNNVADVKINSQFLDILNAKYKEHVFLCKKPHKSDTNTIDVYNYILNELADVKFYFYGENKKDRKIQDLNLRGRIGKANNNLEILLFSKVGPDQYRPLYNNLENQKGKLYENIIRQYLNVNLKVSVHHKGSFTKKLRIK